MTFDPKLYDKIPVIRIYTMINDFTQKHGIVPNTLLVGPDQFVAKCQLVCGLRVKVCDDINMAVALL